MTFFRREKVTFCPRQQPIQSTGHFVRKSRKQLKIFVDSRSVKIFVPGHSFPGSHISSVRLFSRSERTGLPSFCTESPKEWVRLQRISEMRSDRSCLSLCVSHFSRSYFPLKGISLNGSEQIQTSCLLVIVRELPAQSRDVMHL